MRKTLTQLASYIRSDISGINRVIIGKDDNPKQTDLPQIQIYPIESQTNLSGTVKDERIKSISIRAIASVAQNLNQTASGLNTISSMLSVIDIMENQDSNNVYTNSVMGVLRTYPDLDEKQLYNQEMSINYDNLGELGYPNAVAEVNVNYISREKRINC